MKTLKLEHFFFFFYLIYCHSLYFSLGDKIDDRRANKPLTAYATVRYQMMQFVFTRFQYGPFLPRTLPRPY